MVGTFCACYLYSNRLSLFRSLKMGRNFVFGYSVFVPTVENGEELSIRLCFEFFVFRAKSGTKNNNRTVLSDIS